MKKIQKIAAKRNKNVVKNTKAIVGGSVSNFPLTSKGKTTMRG